MMAAQPTAQPPAAPLYSTINPAHLMPSSSPEHMEAKRVSIESASMVAWVAAWVEKQQCIIMRDLRLSKEVMDSRMALLREVLVDPETCVSVIAEDCLSMATMKHVDKVVSSRLNGMGLSQVALHNRTQLCLKQMLSYITFILRFGKCPMLAPVQHVSVGSVVDANNSTVEEEAALHQKQLQEAGVDIDALLGDQDTTLDAVATSKSSTPADATAPASNTAMRVDDTYQAMWED